MRKRHNFEGIICNTVPFIFIYEGFASFYVDSGKNFDMIEMDLKHLLCTIFYDKGSGLLW